MHEIQEAALTVMKMSPPMLIIVVAAIVCMLLKPFLPEKYLAPISVVGAAAVAPWMFSNGTLAYDVPSPGTALVLIGAIMGFIGSVIHRRADRWLRNKGWVGNGHDTKHLTRSDACQSPPAPPAT